MTIKSRRWLWLLLLIPLLIGVARLRFDVEVLNLLPSEAPAVQGLKLYQQHFSNARELIVTIHGPDADSTEAAARTLADALRAKTNLIAAVTWQPPWLEHPDKAAELIAYLWFNQPPETFASLTNRLIGSSAVATLQASRQKLTTSLSPAELARLGYDPFNVMELPGNVGESASFRPDQELFVSADGTFRIIFVKAPTELKGYRECASWLKAIKAELQTWRSVQQVPTVVKFTGRPAFVAEIAGDMERDITGSVSGTALIIALLFWLAHRRWKPMLWLLTLLAIILLTTLALGGLLFGTINVVSMGFAAILLGLAVDYAVVHYQEALAHPGWSVPEVRRAIAPSIFWAAATTIVAFLVLNFGGLPGLAQLGSLVALGVGISATVMIFAYLPPLFPERRKSTTSSSQQPEFVAPMEPGTPARVRLVHLATLGLLLAEVVILASGRPRMDTTADALRPRHSSAYAALEEIKSQLGQKQEPLWLLISGRDEAEVARRLDAVQPVLARAVADQIVSGVTLPTSLWPRTEFQETNRAIAQTLVAHREALRDAAKASGFADVAFALTDNMLNAWQHMANTSGAFWPTNEMSQWILEKLIARTPTNLFAAGLIYPKPEVVADDTKLSTLSAQLNGENVWLSGWSLLGSTIFKSVRSNLWKLLVPTISLVLISLWLAFRRPADVLLSLAVLLLSGLGLLSVMRLVGWSWNLLNLMALPLILGTGVDYSIFMQLALRRHHGDLRVAHRSVGRALLLCGGTAVAGFGSLAFSSNAGMSSLGQICAIGIGFNMLISVLLLPTWWRETSGKQISNLKMRLAGSNGNHGATPSSKLAAQSSMPKPSSFYRTEVWRLGQLVVKYLPPKTTARLSGLFAHAYWRLNPRRREVVIQNLLPVVGRDRNEAERLSKELFQQFAIKIADLWRYESGMPIQHLVHDWGGWKYFSAAREHGRGILLLTPHLGNWELGGPLLAERGVKLLVITLTEPHPGLTELRQASRSRWGIETLVIGENPFAFVEVIQRLEGGATVALLVDRPPPSSAVTVELFGRPFAASIAAAELARATGCTLLPVYLPRTAAGYNAEILPAISYSREALATREAREKLTQQIMRAFEPVIKQHLTQWYHFVPIWPE